VTEHEDGCAIEIGDECNCRAVRRCWRCGEACGYDGWDHVHDSGLGIGSCGPLVRLHTICECKSHDHGRGHGGILLPALHPEHNCKPAPFGLCPCGRRWRKAGMGWVPK
jgi:hypothetical protein